MQHSAAFQQGLHCLLRQIQSSRILVHNHLEMYTCDLVNPILHVSLWKNTSKYKGLNDKMCLQGRIAKWVTYLATDACLTADPEVASSIPAWSHTFTEIDHEIISMGILLPSADSFKKGCCQLQAKVCAQNYWLNACSSLP